MNSPDADLHKTFNNQTGALASSEAEAHAAYKNLVHAQKMQALGSLAGGLVHDFNNVFAAILLQLDLACEQPGLTKSILEDLESAKASATRGADLVKRLLAFCRPAPFQIRELHSCEMIQELVALLERTITRRIHIKATAPLETWSIKGDENQLHLVLITLCLHARDAMPHGGHIKIELSNVSLARENSPTGRPGDFVKILISDTSEGLPESVAEHLFEPNFITKESALGSGLSLSTSQNIIIDHGGWIQVESKPKQGTCFQIYLPRFSSEETCSAKKLPEAKPKASCEGTETVLVADGDEMMRNLLRAVLSYRGYKIIEAIDGTEALEKAFDSTAPIDLLMLDVEHPKLNGWEVLSKVREHQPSLPTILCGGLEHGLKAKALAAGAKNLLQKPFSNPELVRMVRDTLDTAQKSKSA